MAVEIPLLEETFEAGEDLSAAQFKFVKFDGNVGATGCPRVVVCTAATDIPIGVLQDNPKVVGEACRVMIHGVTKVQADASLTVGTLIGTSADGQADAKVPGTDTTNYVRGIITHAAGAAGRYASAFLIGPYRAA